MPIENITMFRRVVALLLLPTVLLTQWASVRQCHGCSQEAGHDLTPHIHLTTWPFAGSAPKNHRHWQEQRHYGYCHHHGGDRDQDNGDKNDSTLVRHNDDSPDHEGEGVVYLPTGLLHGWLTGRTLNSSDDLGNILSLSLLDNLMIQIKPFHSAHAPLSFMALPDRPACLRTLPLII
jgi:hypothetical protein